MRPAMDVRRWLPFCVVALGLVAAARSAGAEAAEAEQPAAEPSESTLGPDAEKRYARGEAFYDGEWMSVEKLFKAYDHQRDRLQHMQKQGTESQEQLNELNREMTRIRGEERKAERPIRLELGKARHQLREYNHVLRQQPPAKPKLQRLPPAPNRSGRSQGYRSRDDRYDRARRQWQQRCDQIKQHNKKKVEQYRREVKEYEKSKKEAKQDIPKLEAKVRELMNQLDEIEKQYKDKAAPTRRRSEDALERVRSHHRHVEVLERKVKELAKAVSAVPGPVRHKRGIVKFEGQFHHINTLQRQYKQTQSEIDRVRDNLQAECQKMGVPFPKDWRHPLQDRMEKIKALIEKVKQARAASGD